MRFGFNTQLRHGRQNIVAKLVTSHIGHCCTSSKQKQRHRFVQRQYNTTSCHRRHPSQRHRHQIALKSIMSSKPVIIHATAPVRVKSCEGVNKILRVSVDKGSQI